MGVSTLEDVGQGLRRNSLDRTVEVTRSLSGTGCTLSDDLNIFAVRGKAKSGDKSVFELSPLVFKTVTYSSSSPWEWQPVYAAGTSSTAVGV
jgi:hypothetical protein